MELFAGPVALDTFQEFLHEQPLLHFIDNNGALGALVKGYSNSTDTIRLVADYWLRMGKLCSFAYLDRVESSSNIADDPSRLNLHDTLPSMGAEYIPPVLTSFSTGNIDRSPFTWFGGDEQWFRMKAFIKDARQKLQNSPTLPPSAVCGVTPI